MVLDDAWRLVSRWMGTSPTWRRSSGRPTYSEGEVSIGMARNLRSRPTCGQLDQRQQPAGLASKSSK